MPARTPARDEFIQVPATALSAALAYVHGMIGLTSLETCLAQALDGLAPVPAEWHDAAVACGHVLAEDVRLTHDLPRAAEALRAGFAVAALDLVGAASGSPVMLAEPVRVLPGSRLPPGCDAVLPENATDAAAGLVEAIRAVGPGEGTRRPGHDGRAGDRIASAGTRLATRHGLIAAEAGIDGFDVRCPHVMVSLEDPAQTAFARGWLAGLGARITGGPAQLTLRPTLDHAPRLALAPAETAWLEREGDRLVLTVPTRFDGMVAACAALALPALAALSGGRVHRETRPLSRKIASTVGLSELVLLTGTDGAWMPQPAGMVTLSGLAVAQAFAILPPDSEGLPAGAPLAAIPLDMPFG